MTGLPAAHLQLGAFQPARDVVPCEPPGVNRRTTDRVSASRRQAKAARAKGYPRRRQRARVAQVTSSQAEIYPDSLHLAPRRQCMTGLADNADRSFWATRSSHIALVAG